MLAKDFKWMFLSVDDIRDTCIGFPRKMLGLNTVQGLGSDKATLIHSENIGGNQSELLYSPKDD